MRKTSFPYYGANSTITDSITKYFPEDVSTFVEVFGGSAEILLAKHPSKLEVYNDIDSGLTAIFECLIYEDLRKQLYHKLRVIPPCEKIFQELKQWRPVKLVDKAFRKSYLSRYSYNANCKTYAPIHSKMYHRIKKVPYDAFAFIIEEFSRRNIVIYNRDFRQIFKKFYAPDTLMYCDPPFYEALAEYEHTFEEQDHLDLFACITKFCDLEKNRLVILSYDDCDFIRELYGEFHLLEMNVTSNSWQLTGKARKNKELLISNAPFVEHFPSFNLSLESFIVRS